jgi:signal transduction histidine kinase/CheY-like chemotaxis protein
LTHRHRQVNHALITLAAVMAAALLRAAISIVLQEPIPAATYVMFYPAIMLAAWYCGLAWGLVGVALSVFAASFWLTPLGTPVVNAPRDLASLGLFFFVSLLIVFLSHRVRKAHAEVERAAEERRVLLIRESAARQAAERASLAKDHFLATISHELRTPLQSILGWVQLLREYKFDYKKAELAAASIERSVKAQNQLINDLLDVSRIVMGKLQLNPQPISLNQVLNAAVETVRPAAQAKNIRIDVAGEAVSGRVLGDADRLQQVAWNLLSNAIKFTPPSGVVAVSIAELGEFVEMRITDTGKGIEPSFLPKIFERFVQGLGDGHREGLGLGLAIVKDLVALHGGSIDVCSEGKGRGAEFKVTLPRHRGPAMVGESLNSNDAALAASEQVDLSGTKVLVVDDDPETMDLVARILIHHGADVLSAPSATEASEILKLHRPDAVTCDLEMPGIDGFEFIEQLRREGNLPAVALTAHTSDDDRRRALESGFQAHLGKPVQVKLLVKTLLDLTRVNPIPN